MGGPRLGPPCRLSVEAGSEFPGVGQQGPLGGTSQAVEPGAEDEVVVGDPVAQAGAEAALELIDAVALVALRRRKVRAAAAPVDLVAADGLRPTDELPVHERSLVKLLAFASSEDRGAMQVRAAAE